jgi:hypothetical protein
LQDPPKFTQIAIFGLKTYHLATLRCGRKKLYPMSGTISLMKNFMNQKHIQRVVAYSGA